MRGIISKVIFLLLAMLLLAMPLTGCGRGEGLQDGYYTAQASDYNFGWKEYITIMVKGGSIVSVEYNAENASGFIKSWIMLICRPCCTAMAPTPMNIPAITRDSFWKAREKRILTG